jgi:hypothetical protein
MRFEELERCICQLWVDAVFGFSRIVSGCNKHGLTWIFPLPGARGKAGHWQVNVCDLSCIPLHGFLPTEIANADEE